jgi:ABC-type bacteriocin/lantibiotic exporter with double-glycine peptidase domain
VSDPSWLIDTALGFGMLIIFTSSLRVIHTLQPNRSESKILVGPSNNFWLHSLNGPVSTPLFNHLGSASWHLYDAELVVLLGKCLTWVLPILIIGIVVILLVVTDRLNQRLQNWRLQPPHGNPVKDLEDRWER